MFYSIFYIILSYYIFQYIVLSIYTISVYRRYLIGKDKVSSKIFLLRLREEIRYNLSKILRERLRENEANRNQLVRSKPKEHKEFM